MNKAIASLAILLFTALVSANLYKPAFYPFGPVNNVAETDLVGWRKCFQGNYLGTENITEVISACKAMGEHYLVGCRLLSETNFFVLAVGSAKAVTTDTGLNDEDTTTVNNGVGWYFNDQQSFGFVKEGDALSKDSCDYINGTYPDLKLCWHAGPGVFSEGYRCGYEGTQDMSLGSTWSREIWAPIDPCEDKPDGEVCEDFNACTTNSTCQSGECTPSGTAACSECEMCDPLVGCTPNQTAEGDTCDDGDACTESDTCQSGVCIGSASINGCTPVGPTAAPVAAPVKAPQAKSSTAGQSSIALMAALSVVIAALNC